MKKTAVIMSAIIAGAMALPTAANARNEYPTFPEHISKAEYDVLSEAEKAERTEKVNLAKNELIRAYQNGEYDWDFNLDGETDTLDTYYVLHYYSELATNSKKDSFVYTSDYEKKEYIQCVISDEMRSKIAEEGDINGDNIVRADDVSCMLVAIFSDKEKGDVNTDGKVDARDASKMLTFYSANSVNIESDYVTEKNMEYLGDLNGDGKLDAEDASYALVEYSKLSTE